MLYFLLSLVVFLYTITSALNSSKPYFCGFFFCPSTESALRRKDTVGGQDSMALIEEVSPGRTYTHGEFQIFFSQPWQAGWFESNRKKRSFKPGALSRFFSCISYAEIYARCFFKQYTHYYWELTARSTLFCRSLINIQFLTWRQALGFLQSERNLVVALKVG